jgi:hypothetical protein
MSNSNIKNVTDIYWKKLKNVPIVTCLWTCYLCEAEFFMSDFANGTSTIN